MDLNYSPEDLQFRKKTRQWLEANVPTRELISLDDRKTWHRTLYDAGYAGINWPREFGGRGATPTEQLIFTEETERARAPYVGCNFVGLLHAGPTLIMEANDEQRASHLPAILKGEHPWCEGFSEPSAGSDLASD